jgi:peptidoglycan hydrolase-like protein with peptidoglycan-binding domain
MHDYLQLSGGVGRGQDNDEDDVAATDGALRDIGAYVPPPEYANEPQRYTTEPMVDALTGFQEQNGLKVDGYALPGGPTERAINNRLLRKPRGAGLLHDFDMQVGDTVGNGLHNDPRDVKSVKRALGGLGYLPEDPFDDPSGFIEESTTTQIRKFQQDRGLRPDGWLQPGSETEAALQDAVDALAHVKAPEWGEYWRLAPSSKAGIEANKPSLADSSVLEFVQNWLSQEGPKGTPTQDTSPSITQLQYQPDGRSKAGPSQPGAPTDNASPDEEGIGSLAADPEANFGSWAIKRSDVLPEGVEPPADPLKPDVLPGVPFEGSTENDPGVNREREVRWLISRLYRVAAQDDQGTDRLSDEDFERYIAVAKEHIKPEHLAVFELTARAVRAGVLDWHTAATRLTAYFVPETTGESVVDLLLDLTPIVGQLKGAKEAHSALEDAVDAANYGDERAYNEAIAKAALAMAGLIMPGAGKAALKALAKLLGKELHHVIPFYLGGIADGPLLPLDKLAHRQAATSLHRRMQAYFKQYHPTLVHSWINPGRRIIAKNDFEKRFGALDAFYRSLQNSAIRHEREAFEAWQKIFPEARRYFVQ